MATLVLQVVGTAVGSIFGPVGAAIGAAVGGIAGAAIDQTLLGSTTRRSGPRLDSLQVMSSTEGAPIPRVYGAMRIGGQVIWATALEEHVSTKKVGQKGARQTVTEYSYSANFAVALCEGPVAHIRRVWADGKPLDLSGVVMRLHRGDEAQAADPLIDAKEGAANAPAYRGTAYVVFEGLALEDFGNRIPQLSFEVLKPVGGIESMLQAITLIPGAGEFVYEDRIVTAHPGAGTTEAVNRHQLGMGSDIEAALDELQALCPRLRHVSLVVSWFGDDLRAGQCSVAPRVEGAGRDTRPATWRVAGLERGQARIVSTVDGKPAYGGTPSDESVVRAIQGLKARGIAVTLYPFLMMDVAIGNALPNPTGGTGQPPYPWRGRITCHPAPGQPGTPDGTSAAAAQVAAFFGTAAPQSFSHGGGAVAYSGPAEWSYRRLALHYAHLAEAAGGVEAFVIGSELIGLTRVRQAPGVYPAVQQLVSLAGDVRSVLRGGAKIVYGADWTEYGAHVLDGAQEVRFPLDPLWASPAIDAVAIDWYAPLSDWRDGTAHQDAAGARSVYDLAYLRANVAAGEGFDWFYASDADRLAQTRTPISDGAFQKPWTFRQKDLVGWWGQRHVERVGGAELPAPTAWVPASKPIWLLEAGCPAVDRGSNRPSTFPDPKSSENGLPVFSNGAPDTLMQARAIEALLSHWDAALPGYAGANPVSPLYGGPMLDASRIYLWAYDARPYPAFPSLGAVWADGPNWRLGHWLTGRLGLPTLDRLVAAILADYGVADFDSRALDAAVPGAVIDRPMTARAALEPALALFSADAVDRAGVITFGQAGQGTARLLGAADLVLDDDKPLVTRSRAQETELPREVDVGFVDPEADYASALESSRRLATESREQRSLDPGLALPRGEAARRADIVLQDAWIARERGGATVPRSAMGLEPGDLVLLDVDGRARLHAVTAIADGAARALDLRRIEPAVFDQPARAAALPAVRAPQPKPLPYALLLDLPAPPDGSTVFQWIAATAKPWPGALNLWRSVDGAGFSLAAQLTRPATIGHLLADLPPGPTGRWDRHGTLIVAIDGTGDLVSASEAEVLDGTNRLALRRPDGHLEIVQFAAVEPVSAGVFRLSGLLRGQAGTEDLSTTIPAGAALVLLDEAVQPLVTSLSDVGRPIRWRVGPAGVDAGDGAVSEVSGAATLRALEPLSPVQAWARREAGGIRLGWIRRTRIGGDTWETEVPLGEEREAYEVDILQGGAVRRTLSATEPGLLYADELADFGGAQSSLAVRIAQISAAAGRGLPEEVTLHV